MHLYEARARQWQRRRRSDGFHVICRWRKTNAFSRRSYGAATVGVISERHASPIVLRIAPRTGRDVTGSTSSRVSRRWSFDGWRSGTARRRYRSWADRQSASQTTAATRRHRLYNSDTWRIILKSNITTNIDIMLAGLSYGHKSIVYSVTCSALTQENTECQ